MPLNPRDPLVGIGITSVICTVPAIISTAYRLWIRRGRYWADDAFALFSALSQFVMFSGSFVHITRSSPRLSMVAAYYMMASAFYSVVWFARLSILFSIIRIHPDEGMRKKLYWVAGIFGLVTMVLISQLYWVVVLQIVTDVFSDAILVFVPLRLIQTLSDTRLRRRLAVIFSTCLITTAVSIVHAVFIFIHAGPQEVMAAIAEDCVSLMVCNVPVVATRLLKKWGDPDKPKTTVKSRSSGLKFATWRTKSVVGAGTTRGGVDGTIPSGTTATTTETTGVGWFRWERELPDDSSESERETSDLERGDRKTRMQAVTLDLDEARSQSISQTQTSTLEDQTKSLSKTRNEPEHQYPPKKSTVTWVEDVTTPPRDLQ
ncbi:hypothetical protein V5O48_006137 [Marasmius crinis-equi]|uniref:Uncharacterized protein n=1 Tax=Marasmius crinis-equi TaxID=585013 RepID=A0ABR3FKZ9_9AGAR